MPAPSTRTVALSIVLLTVVAPLAAGGEKPKVPEKPSVVVILSDDMGYSDLGCYGGEIETPNLDKLGYGGLRFTNFHCCNMCVPTRVTMLTGCYHTRSRQGGRVSDQCVTIAEALKQAGYATAMTGKWHLCPDGDRANWPLQRGFERFFGSIGGCGSFFAPYSLKRGNDDASEEFRENPDFYYTDAISDSAVKYIEETPAEKPLFLYVAYTAAHWPLHALPKDIEKYKGKYAMGWDKLREARHRRAKELGVVDPKWPLSPRHAKVPAWEDEKNKAWQQRRMEVYAAQVDSMDQGIGRILDALKKTGRLDNTLVMFSIDNGACHVEYSTTRKGPFLPAKTRDGRPVRPGNLPDIMPGPEDTYQSYGYGWANAGNTPFRLFKQFSHEGGIRTPLIVHWPKGLKTKPGTITGELAHSIDLLPTCLDVAGAEYPKEFGGKKIITADGKTLVPIFQGKSRKGHDMLFWRWAHGRAIRQGKWKLVRLDNNPWELYDVEADGTEVNDLADKMPEKVKELEGLWQRWAGPGTDKKRKKKRKP